MIGNEEKKWTARWHDGDEWHAEAAWDRTAGLLILQREANRRKDAALAQGNGGMACAWYEMGVSLRRAQGTAGRYFMDASGSRQWSVSAPKTREDWERGEMYELACTYDRLSRGAEGEQRMLYWERLCFYGRAWIRLLGEDEADGVPLDEAGVDEIRTAMFG